MAIFGCDLFIAGCCKLFMEGTTALATCVMFRPCNSQFAIVYLQWFTCDANLNSMRIFLTSSHMSYHMKAHENSILLVKIM